MFKIKRNDTVQVIKGKDKGKKGKVIRVFFSQKKALVEGINQAKKHKRQTRQDQQGGIVNIEMPIALSNLMVFCKNCSQPTRLGFKKSDDGTKARVCRKCQGVM
ncbi:MAG: 50S ribosomal protein L24 [Candidatus Omnitrophica bacterium]|jgi:large subunit ribosomal protein L24|nr:50S ribosomal protein L24 [Candidatus Omnitrophota bacterium]MDD5079107.1 50S ribosomal protein L24 [Candidatus Omnitrophota bacterium]